VVGDEGEDEELTARVGKLTDATVGLPLGSNSEITHKAGIEELLDQISETLSEASDGEDEPPGA